ncbi:hypothetical protein SISNIDRAFT_387527, partial [Sistotremastrum niveocremeum HHB9708]
FQYPDANFVIRTSDSVEFKVFKEILRLKSSVFNDMLLIGDNHPPPSDASSPSNVVDVTENSAVMGALLRYMYPIPRPSITSLAELLPVLEAALKYQLGHVSTTITNDIVSSRMLEEDPLTAYVFASKHNMTFMEQAA